MDQWQKDVVQRLDELREDLIAIKVRMAVNDVHIEGVSKEVSTIKDYVKWIVQSIIGTIILALITWIIGGNLNVG